MEDKAGQELFNKAEKRLQKWLSFGGNKYEDARELFNQAAAKFKLSKNWKEAGNALVRASDCSTKMDSKFDSASALVDASKCFQKAEASREAATCLTQAIELFIDMGRFSNAAKHEKELAELYKNDLKYEEAIAHFRKAADYFNAEDQQSGVNGCLVVVADLLTDLERYGEAVEIYETIAKSMAGNKLLQYQAKNHLLKAIICSILIALKDNPTEGMMPVQEKMAKYEAMDPFFMGGREHELLQAMIAAIEKGDEEAYSEAVREYNSVQTLDDWKTNMLLAIKRLLTGTGGAGEDVDMR